MLLSLMHPAQRSARLLVMLGWMALVTYWSAQGNLPIDQPEIANALQGSQHLIAHLLAFGLLGLLARWAFDGLPRAALWAVILASAFGASDEWHQSFTPGRRAAVDDWVKDTVYAAVALYAWACCARATSLRTALRVAAPMAVAAMFVVGVGLAIRPSVALPGDPARPSLRNVASQVVHTARDAARSTRDLARQVRAVASG